MKMVVDHFIWNKTNYQKFVKYLKNQKESQKFIDFSKKIISTKYEIIGIKVPILRKIAKDISKTDIKSFLDISKDDSYEEIMLQGLVIANIKNLNILINYFNKFIKKIDNWSICDVCCSTIKIVSKNKEFFLEQIKIYLNSKEEFVVRVGLVLLLNYYIYDEYIDEIFLLIDSINRDEYYINMAIAWLISVCFVKQKEKTYKYLKHNHLNKFTYNKSIQKILESFRVSDNDKQRLKKMKI